MSLDQALRQASRPLELGLPALNKVQSAAKRVLDRWPDVIPEPREQDQEVLVRRFAMKYQSGDWQGTRLSEVAVVARILFGEAWRDRTDLDYLRAFLIDEARVSDRGAFLSSMASIYLQSYEPSESHTRQLGAALHNARGRLGARWRRLLEAVPTLFDGREAHRRVASMMTTMSDPYSGVRALGFVAPHAPGFMDHVHWAYVEEVRPKLAFRDSLDQLLSWLKPANGPARQTGASNAIEAILDPWLQREPEETLQSHILDSLIAMYGDPRVTTGFLWSAVHARYKAVVIRWLTGQNIAFFLDVVSRVNESHMWPERRKFWMGLHRQKRIDAAWVAFSYPAVRAANDILGRQRDDRQLRFGKQVGDGYDEDKSLLIMKIGNKIVVDGSHNFKVHIFRLDDQNAPQLFQREYDCRKIRKTLSADSFPHLGNWQGKVLERI